MEIYRDRLIAYSLGNFFTWGFNVSEELGFSPILNVVLDSTGVFLHGRIISCLQTGRKPLILDGQYHASRLIRDLSVTDFSESTPVIAADGVITPPDEP
jgi:hypothetical protein